MIAVSLVMVMSVGLPVVAAAHVVGSTAPASSSSATAAPSSSTAGAAPSSGSGGIPTSPHPGNLVVHKDASGGSPSVDPAVCYYTVCYEPIMNVYETLVNYNGTSTTTYVPTAATCVPGTPQCTTDYGSNPTGTAAAKGFTGMFNVNGGITNGITNGTPVYWTFVIDPAAHFYDSPNSTGWSVWPTDVMFSVARTIAYSDLPFVARTSGWILAQSLLPVGPEGVLGNSNGTWDVYGVGKAAFADHSPFNNTPYDVMSSMLINNSTYCPSSAMSSLGHGCITFVAYGEGAPWSEFLEFVADNLGGSIVPCGFFSAHGGAIPGFVSYANSHGDGTCALSGGATSTDASSFQTYLTSVANGTGTQHAGTGMYSWDAMENATFLYPADIPAMQGTMVGSGPYWSSVALTTSYGLRPNPDYQQPSACGGNIAYAQYTGYCDPAPGHFIENATIYWDSSDGPGLAGYEAGTVDYADISPNHIAEMLSLVSEGKLNMEQEPSIDVFQQSYVTEWNSSVRIGDGYSGINNIPQDFFSYEAARSLLQMSYPFANIENNVWTSDNVKTLIPVGSQLAQGLGCYAPPSTTNGCSNPYTVTFPYMVNGGQVDTNKADKGSAAWWWAQGTNASSPYYDPELAACTPGSPCQFSIEGATGAPSQDSANQLWAASIESITGGAIKPNTPDITADALLDTCGLASPGEGACPVYNFGWIADYPDPTDYQGAYGLPSSSYGGPDDLGTLLVPGTHDYNNATCNIDLPGAGSHLTYSVANLAWWANTLNTTQLPEACQGPAYNIYVDSLVAAAPLVGGGSITNLRVLIYDLGATIENALNFYTWTGQEYPIYTAAPWINLGSLNTNVMIGAGDAQFWFMLKYVTAAPKTVPIVFSAAGVGKGGVWSVTVNTTTLSSVAPGKIIFDLGANYTYTWTASSPDYYVAVPHTGTVTAPAYYPPKQKSATVTVHYKNWGSTITFATSGLPKTNYSWNVIVNGEYSLYVGPNISKEVGRFGNGTYTFAVVTPAGYTVNTPTGGFTVVAPSSLTIHLKFAPYNKFSATFTAASLTGGWCVALKLVKGTGPLAAKPGSVCSATNGPISWTDLANGTYAWTAKAKTKGYLIETGTIVVNGANVAVTVTFKT